MGVKRQSLVEILRPARLTKVVDIGANPIDGVPPYKEMFDAGLCQITGFEPQASALATLLANKGANEQYLPYAVGDGAVHQLNICRASGLTSLLEPDLDVLTVFEHLKPLAEIIEKQTIQTYRLDDIAEVDSLDLLKIDIQGGELSVFQNGVNKLSKAVAIQTEVSFIPLYKGQPTYAEVDIELRRQGFIPHCAAAVKNWIIAPCIINENPLNALNQLLEADIVYVRDFIHDETMDDEQLKHLALIAYHCYGSADLAMRCVMLLEKRGAVAEGAEQKYLDLLMAESSAN